MSQEDIERFEQETEDDVIEEPTKKFESMIQKKKSVSILLTMPSTDIDDDILASHQTSRAAHQASYLASRTSHYIPQTSLSASTEAKKLNSIQPLKKAPSKSGFKAFFIIYC